MISSSLGDEMKRGIKKMRIIDMTEWCDDMLIGWSIEERTRWEGEGGYIPERPWWERINENSNWLFF
jgi:hypothetical protein